MKRFVKLTVLFAVAVSLSVLSNEGFARGALRGRLAARFGPPTVGLGQPPAQFGPMTPPQPFMSPSTGAYINSQGWGRFPRNWHDNGSRGASAAYGGGGW